MCYCLSNKAVCLHNDSTAAKLCLCPCSVVAVDGSRRKMLMSTAFHEAKPTPLHCQLPLAGVQQGTWQNLLLDMAGLTRACFKGSMFQAVDLICLSSAFKVCLFQTHLLSSQWLLLLVLGLSETQSCADAAGGQVIRCCCRFGASLL